jgi:hypothetical protein
VKQRRLGAAVLRGERRETCRDAGRRACSNVERPAGAEQLNVSDEVVRPQADRAEHRGDVGLGV